MLIGLSGAARSGKDSVAAILADYGYKRIAFADKLKELALTLNPIVDMGTRWVAGGVRHDVPIRLADVVERVGWEDAKEFDGVRPYLQLLGSSVRNVVGKNVWVNAARLMDSVIDYGNIVVTDVRYQNEVGRITALGGRTYQVVRPGVGPVNDHQSEHDLSTWEFDGYIKNDGSLEDLAASVKELVKMDGLS
jgi:hypothetical protein